jgi:nucleoside-diphosphate-sugar epimerase
LQNGKVEIFNHTGLKLHMEKRDFIYVNGVIEVLCLFMHHQGYSGIFNLRFGMARTLELAINTFKLLDQKLIIAFIPTPS